MSKITIIAGTTNRLLDVLIEKLNKYGLIVERIQQNSFSQKSRAWTWINIAFYAFGDCIRALLSRPETVAYHFFGPRSLLSALGLVVFRVPYVIHFWGSDYFYWKSRNNFLLRYVCRNAKAVSFANSQMLVEARGVFGEKINFVMLRFGLEALELIDRSSVTKDTNEVRVVVGTNSAIGQQHLKIIEALERVDQNQSGEVVYVFPLNYGDKENKGAIIKRLRNSSINYSILEDYILGDDLAQFRICTDILIQVQKTDAMSGAMLESIYAGAKVITGAWLPYGDLRGLGIDWIEVNDVDEISSQLLKLIDKKIDQKKNKEIVAKIARWSDLTPSWLNCYLH